MQLIGKRTVHNRTDYHVISVNRTAIATKIQERNGTYSEIKEMENRSMINTYASWCRKCLACCCCGNEEEALQRKDIHYVLQETKEPKSGQVADSNQEMNAYSK